MRRHPRIRQQVLARGFLVAVAMWQSFGMRDVVKVSRTDQASARGATERATLIWISGGFQGLFVKTIAAMESCGNASDRLRRDTT